MFYPAVIVFSILVIVALLRDGIGERSSLQLAVAWISGVIALHALATIVILGAISILVDGGWDAPRPTSNLWSLGEVIVAATTILLSVAFALYLRRKPVIYLALISLPVLILYWMPFLY